MRKKIVLALIFIFIFAFGFLHASEKDCKLELNNEQVMDVGEVINYNGTAYADAYKLSRVLNLDFFSTAGGKNIVMRTFNGDREYFIYFKPIEEKPQGQIAKVLGSYDKAIEPGLSLMSYMTTEMYDKLEQETKGDKRNIERQKFLRGDYKKFVDESYYMNHEGDFFVPVKDLAQGLGITLKWDEKTSTVLLYTLPEDKLPRRKVHRIKFTEEDVTLLARLATVEAGSGSENKKLAVCNVVLNRVENPGFPNTISGVIFHPGQFPPALDKSFNSIVPLEDAKRAAIRALYGENNVPKVLFFNFVPFESKTKEEFFGVIEGDYFYY